jgi:hypothetical protein
MCGKPGIIERDGKTYCKFHDPPVEQARKAKQNSKWQAKWEKKRKIWDRERLAMKALLYLERTQPDWESHA